MTFFNDLLNGFTKTETTYTESKYLVVKHNEYKNTERNLITRSRNTTESSNWSITDVGLNLLADIVPALISYGIKLLK